MLRHRTDVVAFVFATCFLVCAGLAIGVRTGNLGLGSSTPDGAWIAGSVLAIAGVVGVVGTLSSLRRNAATTDLTPTDPIPTDPIPTEAGPADPFDTDPTPTDPTDPTDQS